MFASRTHAILSVTGLLLAALPVMAADGLQTVRGRVAGVEAAAHQITVSRRNGERLTFDVGDRSELQVHQRHVQLDQFKKGMEVVVAYETEGGKNRVVSMATVAVTVVEVREQVKESLQAARSYTYQQREEYQKRLQAVLGRLDNRMEELREKAEQAGAEAKVDYEEQLAKLRPLRERVQERLAKAKATSSEAWDDFKSDVSSALEDVQHAIERAINRFK